MTLEIAIGIITPLLWLAWLTYWWLSARNVKPTRFPESFGSQLRHRVPVIMAGILLGAPAWIPRALTRRFLPAGGIFPVLGTIMLAAGLAFTVWARRHLGRNWSASVVVKEDHTLIRTGPYHYVRHPIYTGILFAFLGMVVVVGEWRGLLAMLLAFVSFSIKSRAEEKRMMETFPEYGAYRRETAALIPFVY